MIGLELLQSLQIIYFVHLINSNYTSPFSVFMYLAKLGYNFSSRDDHSSNIYSFKLNVKYSQGNYDLVFGCILIPTAFMMVFLLYNMLK